jgi:hypothetical protein
MNVAVALALASSMPRACAGAVSAGMAKKCASCLSHLKTLRKPNSQNLTIRRNPSEHPLDLTAGWVLGKLITIRSLI